MPKPVPASIQAKEWQQAEQAFALLLSGKSQRQVAQEMGVSLALVQRRVAKYKAETVQSRAEELREVQHARIQAGIAANWKGYLQGDKDATQSVIRLMEREARLMGLDSAQAFTVQTVQVNDELEVLRMLAAMDGHGTIPGEIVRSEVE
ncbi:hypothetical protein ABTX80_13775 [Streptomyces erythrochromogenes]|uniref:hypothetical protein n=1 Tax=Streptomyces erythrochromogenes TaxID=285574 RepID=UPI00331730DD